MTTVPRRLGLILLVATPLRARGQAPRMPLPPIRPLGQIEAMSTELLKTISAVRVLSDGRVLALDVFERRVVLFDQTLAHARPVIDTTDGTAKSFGSGDGALFPFPGDSSLFVDENAHAILVLDPAGKIARTVAAPALPSKMGSAFLTMPGMQAAFVAPGSFVTKQRGPGMAGRVRLDSTGRPFADAPPLGALRPDSAALARVNIATRQWDTVAYLMVPTNYFFTPAAGGQAQMRNPLPSGDAYTVLSDGTIALLRTQDYHVDWLTPDGRMTPTPRIDHQWIHLSDSAKAAIVDSARRADSVAAAPRASQIEATIASNQAAARTRGQAVSAGQATVARATMGAGFFPDPSVLPDYLPPFGTIQQTTGNVQPIVADANGNLWIRARIVNPPDGGPVYDIVNRQGVLVDRVQIPGATAIVGFGPGVVYLTSRTGDGVQLARARVR